MLYLANKSVAAGNAVGILFLAGNKHDYVPAQIKQGLLEFVVDAVIVVAGSDIVVVFQGSFGLMDRSYLDDKLIAVKEGVEHFGVQNRCFGYSEVQRVLSANRHR